MLIGFLPYGEICPASTTINKQEYMNEYLIFTITWQEKKPGDVMVD